MAKGSAAQSLGAYRSWETRRERDEFAAANIPTDLIPLWEKTKLNFRGSPEQRAQKFVEYAHDHEDEGVEAIIDESDRKLEAMIRAREARDRSGGFVSLETLVLGLGLAAVGYLAWRVLRKKPAPPTPPSRVGAWNGYYAAPQPVPPMWPAQINYDEWESYTPPPPPYW